MESGEAAPEELKTAPGEHGFNTDPLEDCCGEFVKLDASGNSHSSMPEGFSSAVKDLPDKLVVKIWGYLKVNERHCMRLVSKRYKQLWEHCSENKVTVSEICLKAKNDKLTMDARKTSSWWKMGKSLLFDRDPESMRRALSLVKFKRVRDISLPGGPLLVLADSPLDSHMVKALIAQNWKIHTIVLEGRQAGLTQELATELLAHLSPFEKSGFSVIFQCRMPSKFLAMPLIKACEDRLEQFCVFPHCAETVCTDDCVQITDQSLREFARHGRSIRFSTANGITIQGISDFIKIFFESGAKDTMGDREPEFCTVATETINIDTVGKLKLKIPDENLHVKVYADNSYMPSFQADSVGLAKTGSILYTGKKRKLLIKLYSRMDFNIKAGRCRYNDYPDEYDYDYYEYHKASEHYYDSDDDAYRY